MTTEARDALAEAVHALHPGAHTVIVMAANLEEHSTPDEFAAAILAALDGWTLVPVETVADAEIGRALLRALDDYPDWGISRSTQKPTRYFANREMVGSDEYGEGPTLASAVRAALGDEHE